MATAPSLENVTVLKGGEESRVIQVKNQSIGNKTMSILNPAICSNSCENGNCSQPGDICACFEGWIGMSCDEGTGNVYITDIYFYMLGVYSYL